jgi:chemotaxis protein MotB
MRTRRGRVVRQDLWPGFVDALASLLMVVIFLLSVFAIAQHFLSERLSGREQALAAAEGEIAVLIEESANLSDALAAATARRNDLQSQLTTLEKESENISQALIAARADLSREGAEKVAVEQQLKLLLDKVQTLEKSLLDAQEINNQAIAKAELQASEIARLTATLEALQSEANEAKAAYLITTERAELTLSRAIERAARAEAARDALAKRASELEEALRTAAAALEAATSAKGDAEANAAALVDRLKEQETASSAAVLEYRNRIASLEAKIADMSSRAEALQNAAVAAELGLAGARRDAQGLEAAKRNAEAEQRALASLNAELQFKIDALNAALTEALEQAKTQGSTILQLEGKLNAALAAKVSELRRFRSEFFGKVSEVVKDRSDIRVEGDRFVLQSEVLFETAQADLGPEGVKRIETLASALKEIIATIPPEVEWVLRIDGHTDIRPISTEQFASNRDLSLERAQSVSKVLAAAGIPQERLLPAGFGEYRPIDKGKTLEAYRRNRRIEIRLDQP